MSSMMMKALPVQLLQRKVGRQVPRIRWQSGGSGVKLLFDPDVKALQKARAALAADADKYDYLRDHMATQIVDRLDDIPRHFARGLDLFCGSAHVLRALEAREMNMEHGMVELEGGDREQVEGDESNSNHNVTKKIQTKVGHLTHADIHHTILERAARHFPLPQPSSSSSASTSMSTSTLSETNNRGMQCKSSESFTFREGERLPFEDNSLDVVLSSGGLHWVSDLTGVLRHVNRALKPDGVFIGAMLGAETLQELRISMQLAEDELRKRVAPRISPMIHLRDVANLLSAGGFAMPTADYERITVTFSSMHDLMRHLRGMGETNALFARELHYGKKTFERAAEIYKERFGFKENDGEGGELRIPATFDIMYMIGWAPSASQPSAMQRGSAEVSLADLHSMSKKHPPKEE